MTVKSLGARDHRIDFIRGLALLTIFINHVPGNVLEPFTHKNFGLTDSAELFVVLAGIAAAFAYFPRFSEGHRLLASLKAVKRAGTLYVAHVASIVAGIAVFAWAAVHFGRTDLLDTLNIAPVMADPVRGLVGLAAMTHQIGYHNILPMYVLLLLALPLMMLLASRGLAPLLGVSAIVYALTQIYGWSPPAYPAAGHWFFNPFAWQLLFVTGFFVGVRLMQKRPPVPYVRPLWWLALAYLVAGCVFHRWNLYGSMPDLPLPDRFYANEKPFVAIGRLLHILSLLYVVGHSGLMDLVRRLPASNPLTVAGRHALPVFWTGTLLCMVGQTVMAVYAPTAGVQLPLLALAIAIQAGLAYGLDWMASAEKAARAGKAAGRAEPGLAAGVPAAA
ncbi:OpgC family protein [Chthonobacter rhizosphaerae]|uniref:OpgC family protein n=1 Tax=Chthonobacter rhizosphaerae TaxID=2735553 RepID=UPI0015EFC242|nr:OpgC domain-containing protein [Chthonobacter rhizosphaerae]